MNTSQDPGAEGLDGGTRTHPEAQPPARRKSMVAQVKPTAIPMFFSLDQHAGKTPGHFCCGLYLHGILRVNLCIREK